MANNVDFWADAGSVTSVVGLQQCAQDCLSQYVGLLRYIACFRSLHNDPVQVIALTFVHQKKYVRLLKF